MQTTYNDFAGEIIAESYRTGKPRKPNFNNAISKERKRKRAKFEQDCFDNETDFESLALADVEANKGQIQKYCLSKGEIPADSIIDLAIQANALRQNEIQDFAQALGVSNSEAEAYLEEGESKALEIGSPEADSFLGAIFESIGRVAGRGLQKAADKRQAKGKKPGVAGFLANILNPGGVVDPAQGLDYEAQMLFEKIKAEEKKKEIKKMIPLIIGAVVVLVLITFLITKRASK